MFVTSSRELDFIHVEEGDNLWYETWQVNNPKYTHRRDDTPW